MEYCAVKNMFRSHSRPNSLQIQMKFLKKKLNGKKVLHQNFRLWDGKFGISFQVLIR